MKVIMKYDQGVKREERVTLEASDREFEEMIERDYQTRLSSADDPTRIKRRTAQEIVDVWNRMERNSWQTHHRRKALTRKWDTNGCRSGDFMDSFADQTQTDAWERRHDYETLCDKLSALLTPELTEMIVAICIEGYSVKEYAQSIGENLNTVYARFRRTKKFLSENFSR